MMIRKEMTELKRIPTGRQILIGEQSKPADLRRYISFAELVHFHGPRLFQPLLLHVFHIQEKFLCHPGVFSLHWLRMETSEGM